MINTSKMCSFLNGLSVGQLVLLIQRYDLEPRYNNPQNRKREIIYEIQKYWSNNSEECAICYEPLDFNTVVATPCAHLFCDTCVIPHIKRTDSCPLCRTYCTYNFILDKIYIERMFVIHKYFEEQKKIIQQQEAVEEIVQQRPHRRVQNEPYGVHYCVGGCISITACFIHILSLTLLFYSVYYVSMDVSQIYTFMPSMIMMG
jgi:hypothetical protein